jgi:murein DD-endopeptidase MepM/ murein hydrolase activator NlpD
VGSKSVGDLISRQNFLRSIAKQDREVFEAYTATQREVDEKAKRQAKVVERVHALVANQRAQKAELEDTRAEKGEILEGLRAKQGELRKMLAQFEADESAISAEIAAYRRRAETNPVPVYKGRFIHPVPGRITSRFGMRFHPVLRYTRMHQGVDFGARYGTAIRAVADGRVISAGYGGGYGNRVILDHGGGTMTLYGHCSRLTGQVGQTVRQGQLLGAVGASGLATGPHLHFEVWRNGQRVNPLGFL